MPKFKFYYTLEGVLGNPGKDLLIEAHIYNGEVELDHAWDGGYDVLPVLQHEERLWGSELLDHIFEAGEAHTHYRKELNHVI